MTNYFRNDLTATGLESTLLFSAVAQVEMLTSKADMLCSNEVLASGGAGKGTAELIGDKMLKNSADTVGPQRSDMRARKYYVDVRTAKFPDEEIRSQLAAK
jgi:hypothetical protein